MRSPYQGEDPESYGRSCGMSSFGPPPYNHNWTDFENNKAKRAYETMNKALTPELSKDSSEGSGISEIQIIILTLVVTLLTAALMGSAAAILIIIMIAFVIFLVYSTVKSGKI